MKITIEKTPNVYKTIETIYPSDMGIDDNEWRQMTKADKEDAISAYVNHPDSLANENFHFTIEIINE